MFEFLFVNSNFQNQNMNFFRFLSEKCGVCYSMNCAIKLVSFYLFRISNYNTFLSFLNSSAKIQNTKLRKFLRQTTVENLFIAI